MISHSMIPLWYHTSDVVKLPIWCVFLCFHICLYPNILNSLLEQPQNVLCPCVKHIYTFSFVPQIGVQLWVCKIPQSLKLESPI